MALLLGIAALALAQGPKDYYSALAGMSWDTPHAGPVVAVCLSVDKVSANLSGMDRKVVQVGAVRSVAPLRMITLDTAFTEQPNLYDGMPRDLKVLYLLTTLSGSQWTRISADGLSMADCSADQAAVMRSLFPHPFQWTESTAQLSEHGGSTIQYMAPMDTPVNTLSDTDLQSVKLRLDRHLLLIFKMRNGPGTTFGQVRDHQPGERVPRIKEDFESGEFGHQVEVESPNALRKSQLNYRDSRLSPKIPMVAGESVPALLQRIAAACNLELYADPHYSYQRMFEAGADAPAGDLLAAVALSISGTFRKVGPAYVLTCDLEGVGTHQAQLATWENDLSHLVNEREDAMRAAIEKSDKLSLLKYAESAYGSLTSQETANVAANDAPDQPEAIMNTADSSPAIQKELTDYRGGNDIDRTKVGIETNVQFEFVLPDGRAADGGWLGQESSFRAEPHPWQPPNPAPVSLPLHPSPALSSLVLAADNADEAISDVKRTKALGVPEVWIETRNRDAVTSAVSEGATAGLKVRLAIRPWKLDRGASVGDSDRSILLDHGTALEKRKQGYVSYRRFWESLQAFDPEPSELLSPLDARVPAQWSRFQELASVPGLSGVVLMDAYPTGYAKQNQEDGGSYDYPAQLDMAIGYGYSEAQRYAFLRQYHVDPLDLESEIFMTRVRWFSHPWAGAGTTSDHYKDLSSWGTAKGVAIHDQLLTLCKTLSANGLPLTLEGQPPVEGEDPRSYSPLFAWDPSTDLPLLNPLRRRQTDLELPGQIALRLRDTDDPTERNRVADRLKTTLEKRPSGLILDLASIPPARIDAVLDAWLTPP